MVVHANSSMDWSPDKVDQTRLQPRPDVTICSTKSDDVMPLPPPPAGRAAGLLLLRSDCQSLHCNETGKGLRTASMELLVYLYFPSLLFFFFIDRCLLRNNIITGGQSGVNMYCNFVSLWHGQ